MKPRIPWGLVIATPGAYSAIRESLRDRGLTDKQIDRLLIGVTRAEEINLVGVGPTVIYQSPQAVAEFSGVKPSPVSATKIRTLEGVEALEIQVPDIILGQIQVPDITPGQTQVPEITPIQPEPTKPEEPEPPKEAEPDKPKIPPVISKKKGDPGSRPNVFRALVGGLKEEYGVTFDYPKGRSESFTVTARSFPQALSQAQQKRRIKYVPSEVDIVKRGKG